jgi:DNA polymerase-1
MSASNVLLLVDGSSYLYRAYHAMPDLRSAQGFPTGAIHRLRRHAQAPARADIRPSTPPASSTPRATPSATTGTPSTRPAPPPMPERLARQIEPIHEVVRLLGWPVLEVPGVEADDVIGTLARVRRRAAATACVVSTGDKDLAQLVTPQVTPSTR